MKILKSIVNHPIYQWIAKLPLVLFPMIIASVLSVIVTLYIQSKSKPRLFLDAAWGIAVAKPLESDGQEFVNALFDLETKSIFPDSMTLIRFEPKDGFTYDSDRRDYTGKLILQNEGGATATNVRIGLGYRYLVDFSSSITPNVKARLTTVSPEKSENILGSYSDFPTIQEINIEELPPHENAIITLGWFTDSSTVNVFGENLTPGRLYTPIPLYLTSQEAVGELRSRIPYESAARIAADMHGLQKEDPMGMGLSIAPGATMIIRKITDEDKIKFNLDIYEDRR